MPRLSVNNRRVFLINPPFQKRFIAYTAGIGLGVIGIFYVANTYFFWRLYEQGKRIGLQPGHPFFNFVDGQRFVMDMIFLITSAVVLSVVLLYGLRMSNRIAGPIYHLEQHLKTWLGGVRGKTLKFRRSDYFQEIAILVDRCLNERLKEAQETQDQKKAS